MLGNRKAPPRLFEFFIARVNHGDPHWYCLPVFTVGLVPVATPSQQIVVSAKGRSWIIYCEHHGYDRRGSRIERDWILQQQQRTGLSVLGLCFKTGLRKNLFGVRHTSNLV